MNESGSVQANGIRRSVPHRGYCSASYLRAAHLVRDLWASCAAGLCLSPRNACVCSDVCMLFLVAAQARVHSTLMMALAVCGWCNAELS